ncbi:MAG: DUF3488 and transglutaminase-like domain-containing protein [Eubacterium sp.]|nr:DUF3488 and transglutaminase-like domain-containing protein [Eubacterium sp.]
MGVLSRLDDKNIWRMINTALIVCIGLSCAKNLLGISGAGAGETFTAGIMIFIITLMDRATLRGRLFGLVVIGALLSGAGVVIGLGESLRFLESYLGWLTGLSAWEAEWVVGYETMQTIVLVLAGYLLELVMEKNFRLKAVGGAALIAWLLYALFAEKEMSKPGVAFMICYILLIYAEGTQRGWQKERGRSIQAYMVWIAPFVAVYFVFMMFCAVPDEPYDWKFVKNVYERLEESFRKVSQSILRGKGEDYDLSLSGFSERGDIGSDTAADGREIMRIWDENGLVTNVYLSGRVYDTFDGRQWVQMNEDASKERYMDTVETMYAVRRYDDKYFADYMKYADFKIGYRYFRTEYLFTPLKPWSFIYGGERLEFRESGGSLFFDKPKGYGTEYEVSFYQLNAGQEAFDRFLNGAGAQPADEEVLLRLFSDLEKRTGVHISAEDMRRHRQEVFSNYTEPVELSDGARQYIDEITADAQTDVEKLRVIEEELSAYHYTLAPGSLPGTIEDGGKFLDYFLLDSRCGYCSHFATAFTLLARAEGFPARYVQGFCVPLQGKEETVVYSDMAHAWPEVYLDGIGWIPYEPTPGYSQIRYTPWAVQNGADSFAVKEEDREEDAPVLAEESGQLPEREEVTGPTGYMVWENILRFLRLAGIALLFAGMACLVVCILNRLIVDYRYQKMSDEEKLKVQVRRNMQILSVMGIGRREETLEEFRKRVEGTTLDKGSLQFLEDYEGILYGSRLADTEIIDRTKNQQEELLLLLKKKKRWAYVYCLFLIKSR